MKIKELIEKLQKHPNKDAEIILNINVIDPEDDRYDIESELEVFSEDDFYENEIELLITPISDLESIDDDQILEKHGWDITSEYPLHIKNLETGSFATLEAAEAVIHELRYSNNMSKYLNHA